MSLVERNISWNFENTLPGGLTSGGYTIKSLLTGDTSGLSFSGYGLHITTYNNIAYVDLRNFHTEVDSSFKITMAFKENKNNNPNFSDVVYFCFGNIFKTHSGGHIIVYRDYSKNNNSSRPRLCTISRTTGLPINSETFVYSGPEFSNTVEQSITLTYDSTLNTLQLRSAKNNELLDEMTNISLSIGHPFLYLGSSTWYSFGNWNFKMDKAETLSAIVSGTEKDAYIKSLSFTSGAL